MTIFTSLFAICCLATAAKARPGYSHGSGQLEGVPDIESFNHIQYPRFDLLELGEYTRGHVPADVIHESKHITVRVPEPYPVKVPVPHPVPVSVPKPYPVVETKYIRVPQPVPYEVVKKVPYPVEVPKPYPVPAQGHGGQSSDWDSYHAGSGTVEHIQSQEAGAGGGDLGGAGQHISSYESQGYDGEQESQEDWRER